MFKKLQLAVVATAIAATSVFIGGAPVKAQEIIVRPHVVYDHPYRAARRHCQFEGGVWTKRHGCMFPGETRYRYRTYYTPGSNVYYRGGYWRNGVWVRYND